MLGFHKLGPYRQTNRHTYTDRQTDRHTDRQSHTQTDRHNTHIYTCIHRNMYKHEDTSTHLHMYMTTFAHTTLALRGWPSNTSTHMCMIIARIL